MVDYDIIQEEILLRAFSCGCCGQQYELGNISLDGAVTLDNIEFKIEHVEKAVENGKYDDEFLPYVDELLSELRSVRALLQGQDKEYTRIELKPN